ncbi:MAG: menaquinone biosynthesis decarboxylase [Bacteroidales bacterium]|nr:menaquinone biosynthesis decarboxylase [Bacteroidales bacterium]
MTFKGLNDFVKVLEEKNEIYRIKTYINPELEITEITDRVYKAGGKALLFENNGSEFPLLINMYGSEERMALAIGRENLEEAGKNLEQLYKKTGANNSGFFSKLKMLPSLRKLLVALPKKLKSKGSCQQVINMNPDLYKLPVLKCWPYDGGPFITLPVVHTRNPENNEVNAGMYRMQVFDKQTTGMHWHRHKTGANHYELYKKRGEKMPLSVTLGGDPVYTYCATAPLPEGIDEYMLAGFLRNRRINMVKCISNDLWVPEDADIVIEGYVDPQEELIYEGPFGDHTGFYSLADWYPRFHVTAITHRKDAVYPATIVGIPPQEDAVIGLATERLFLYPIKMAMQPDIVDFHMPPAGVAHNLVLVKIKKTYPGQGMKVISGLFGAGQMMFSKFIVVVDDDADLLDYKDIVQRVSKNCDLRKDLLQLSGPLDILDHAADSFSYGGKLGIDATRKHKEELVPGSGTMEVGFIQNQVLSDLHKSGTITALNLDLIKEGLPIILMGVHKDGDWRMDVEKLLSGNPGLIVFVLDRNVDLKNLYHCSWQILSNTDPSRDMLRNANNIIVNSTAKNHKSDNFSRNWPNVVVSDNKTIEKIDKLWEDLNIGELIESPSLAFSSLIFKGGAEVIK